MKKVFLALMCMASVAMFTACIGGNTKKQATDGKTETKIEKIRESGFAVKYTTNYGTYIYTCKGSDKRLDKFDSDREQSVYIETFIKGEGYTGYGYDDGAWDIGDISARQTVNNYYASGIQDLTKYFVAKGYSKTGTIKICGKECDVYSGQLTENLNIAAYNGFCKDKQGEIAVWNGITMRTKLDDKIISEVVALSFDIPNEAFGKTTEVTWIK